MRIVWQNDRFEAIFTPGDQWQADLEAAKAAGFKTNGPPAWIWSVSKATAIARLRKNRPASGLTITREALEKFQTRLPEEEKNAALLEVLKEAKKRLKKIEKIEERTNNIPEY